MTDNFIYYKDSGIVIETGQVMITPAVQQMFDDDKWGIAPKPTEWVDDINRGHIRVDPDTGDISLLPEALWPDYKEPEE